MDHITQGTDLKRLMNEGRPATTDSSELSISYATKVGEQLSKMFAGNPARPSDEEFQNMIEAWTETLATSVPEHRFVDVFIYARANRNSNFIMDVSEVCAAWRILRETERHALPRIGQYDYKGTSVCQHCNGTGTKLFVKRDPIIGRDYTYGACCGH